MQVVQVFLSAPGPHGTRRNRAANVAARPDVRVGVYLTLKGGPFDEMTEPAVLWRVDQVSQPFESDTFINFEHNIH